ncbi:MAG: hypothetical protein H6553_03565 [Chitinophagales bacterium]|nr:hypothetical protein [Chitinophagales bacterium]
MEQFNVIMWIIIPIASALLGVIITAWYFNSRSNSKKDSYKELKAEHEELKKMKANFLLPSNDAQAMKHKVFALEKENCNLEKQLKSINKDNELHLNELVNTKYEELTKQVKQLKSYIIELEEELSFKNKDDHQLLTKKEKIISIPDDELDRIKAKNTVINFDRIGFATIEDKDDLTVINGIGANVEKRLNLIGIFTLEQIANFNDEDIIKVNHAIEFFPGRIAKDNWVEQAKQELKFRSII